MTNRVHHEDPLTAMNRLQHEEIEKYKWIESEKAGIDIGWERAATEWLDRHFPAWKKNNWQRAVQEAVAADIGWNQRRLLDILPHDPPAPADPNPADAPIKLSPSRG